MRSFGQALALSGVLLAASAMAQTAKPQAEAAAAMERARRQAAGPMRIILEASKARRKAGDADPPMTADPALKAAAARTAGAAPAQPAPTDGRVLVAATSSGDVQRTAVRAAPAGEVPLSQPLAAQASTPDGMALPSPTLSSGVLQSRPVGAAVPSLEVTTAAPLASALLARPAALPFAAVPSAAAPAEAARPRLLSMIEPELPQRVLDQLGRNATVLLDLTISPDGSVTKVAVLSPAPRQLERALAPTLEQWRFEPLAAERVHRVELVFNSER